MVKFLQRFVVHNAEMKHQGGYIKNMFTQKIAIPTNGSVMLKEAAAVTGGALLLPPLGVSIVACGVPGLLIAGAGMFIADAVMKEKRFSETSYGIEPDECEKPSQGSSGSPL
jgi:hypothetical protein